MPFIFIKNNLKLILRSKWLLIIMVVSTVAVTAVLGGVFEEMMRNYYVEEEFYVGYRIEEESIYYNNIESIKEIASQTGMTFVEYPSGEIKDIYNKELCLVFVSFEEKGYTLYKTDTNKEESNILEYFLSQVISKQILLQKKAAGTESIRKEINIPVKQLKAAPNIEAMDYYGIVYIVYFIWCSFICLSPVLSSERKYGIDKKYKTTPVSNLGLYAAKAIPCIITTLLITSLSIFLSTCLLDIKWGNYWASAFIILMTILASTALGLMFCYLFRNLAISVAVSFMFTWIAGFFGGTFETYLYASHSQILKMLSPMYHINRVLIEYSAWGESDNTASCIIYLSVIIVVCFLISILWDCIKREEKP